MAASATLPSPDEPDPAFTPSRSVDEPGRRPLDRRWRRSSFSTGADMTCVEVALDEQSGGGVLLRQSQDPDGPVLRFTAREWAVFLRGVRAGEFALP